VAALLQLFQQQQQQAADREQRREERREEQRREDRREAAEREERLEARITEREARLEAHLLQTPSTASVGYRICAAAKEFRPFEGKEDGAAYILELTHLLGTHEVPVAQWPRELSLKLKGSAAN
jgi:sRNA-binding protein